MREKAREGKHTDGEADLDEDEEELDPEGNAQHAMLPVLDAQTLELPADENSRNDVADTTWYDC